MNDFMEIRFICLFHFERLTSILLNEKDANGSDHSPDSALINPSSSKAEQRTHEIFEVIRDDFKNLDIFLRIHSTGTILGMPSISSGCLDG